jgi:AcrR family transcriptional regulator
MARPRLITDEQILATTRATVLEHGPGVSLDVVAERLGVTAPALLKRFGNRGELMLAALKPPDRPEWIDEFLKGPDARALEVQLAEHFGRLWDYFQQTLPCISALRESGIPHEKIFDHKKNSPAVAIKAIAAWVGQAQDAGLVDAEAPESVATAMLGALQIRAFTSHVAKVQFTARSNREYLDDVVNLFTRALAPKGSKKRPTA